MTKFEFLNNFDWDSVERIDCPFFIYDIDEIFNSLQNLKKYFSPLNSKIQFNFSLKSNPHPPIIRFLDKLVDGFDTSSAQEILYCEKMGISSNRNSLSGPNKGNATLLAARKYKLGVVQVDSVEELVKIQKIGIGDFSLRMHHGDRFSSKLGLTKDDMLLAKKLIKTPASGLHCYLGRESYSEARLFEAISKMTEWIVNNPGCFIQIPTLFIGPGVSANGVQHLPPMGIKSKFPVKLEIGRSVVSNSGFYCTRILSRKKMDFGQDVIIVNGGLQHLGSPYWSLNQPNDSFHAALVANGRLQKEKLQEFIVAGSLCLGHDVLHPRLQLPESAARGEWIIFPQSGSYGLTAGVPFFIGQNLAREFCYQDGKFIETTVKHFRIYHECF